MVSYMKYHHYFRRSGIWCPEGDSCLLENADIGGIGRGTSQKFDAIGDV